jgi:1,4-alpha-glucan branching enzyme
MNTSKIVFCIITVLVISLSGCQNSITPDQASSLSLTRIITPSINPEETINTSTPSPTATSIPDTLSNDPNWWKDAVFYEIYVRSFYDSDGDGIGDFNGITQKLDYLNDGNPSTSTDLGITAIWLMPIMSSPSVHGYNVTDYYTTNP